MKICKKFTKIFATKNASQGSYRKNQETTIEKPRKVGNENSQIKHSAAELKLKADHYLSNSHYRDAINILEKMYTNSNSIMPALNLAMSYMYLGEMAKARDILRSQPQEKVTKMRTHLIYHIIMGKSKIEGKKNTITFEIKPEAVNVPYMLQVDSGTPAKAIDFYSTLKNVYHWGTSGPKYSRKYKITGLNNFYVEFGFIGGKGLAVDNAVQRALIVTKNGIYYDCFQQNDVIERLISPSYKITPKQHLEAKECIDKILTNNISKYHRGPNIEAQIAPSTRQKLLIVDQRQGDKSLTMGGCNDTTYKMMLEFALSHKETHEIHLKTHPDSTKEGYQSNIYSQLSEEEKKNFIIHRENINPVSFLRNFDIIVTATSQMGFEACLLDKSVHVFGAPFYSGWGFTHDYIHVPNRSIRRSKEEIFYEYYINNSIYFAQNSPTRLVHFLREELK